MVVVVVVPIVSLMKKIRLLIMKMERISLYTFCVWYCVSILPDLNTKSIISAFWEDILFYLKFRW